MTSRDPQPSESALGGGSAAQAPLPVSAATTLETPPDRVTPAPATEPVDRDPRTTAAADQSAAAIPTVSRAELAELDAYIRDAMKRFRIPGAEVGVVYAGHIVQLKGYGVRAVGSSSPVTPDTLMLIGSTGKSMTTMMMGTLVDDHEMSWDTPAIEALSSFATSDPQRTPILTLRDLVSNATGIQQRDAILKFADGWTPSDLIHSLPALQFTGQFGKTYGYSNQLVATGGYLAAQMSDCATGDLYRDYTDAMQGRVFNPIGMTSTTFSFDTALANPDHATGSTFRLDDQPASVPADVERPLVALGPAGGAWSNARDMSRYLLTQLARGVAPSGRRVISEANLRKTWTKQVDIAPGVGYGLGWLVGDFHGRIRITHGGGTIGFGSTVDFLPGAQLGVVVLANASDSSLFGSAVAGRLYELAFGRPYETDAKVAARYDAMRTTLKDVHARVKAGADPADVSRYVGVYRNSLLGTATVSLRDGRLVFSAGTFSTPLGWLGDHDYVALNAPIELAVLTLSHDSAGKPSLVFNPISADDPGRYLFKRR
jgi:CubicO group peptidase (beta-lactamase class C family)